MSLRLKKELDFLEAFAALFLFTPGGVERGLGKNSVNYAEKVIYRWEDTMPGSMKGVQA